MTVFKLYEQSMVVVCYNSSDFGQKRTSPINAIKNPAIISIAEFFTSTYYPFVYIFSILKIFQMSFNSIAFLTADTLPLAPNFR